MQHTRVFPRGVVVTPNHLASEAGVAVLRAGGNAVDAAVAASAALGVLTPYHCGPGGDLFAIVTEPDGEVHALDSAGRTPAGLTLGIVLDEVPAPRPARVPSTSVHSVTVPGAVAGWAALLERWGTVGLDRALVDAIRFAEEGVEVSPFAAARVEASRLRFAAMDDWRGAFGGLRAGEHWRQPEHAAFLRDVAGDGPGVLYGGHRGEQLVEHLASAGSTMTLADLTAHEVRDVRPLATRFGELEVLELPPPTQGVTALQALGVLDRLRRDDDRVDSDEVHRVHLQVEAARGAVVDRAAHVTDPGRMRVEPASLVSPDRLDALAAAVDRDRAGDHPPATPASGGTAHLCTADAEGRTVSLINSNFMGFGSGFVAPFGVTLQNRGAQLSLDPDHVDVVAPGVRPMHTLIPAVARRDGEVVLTFGTMGGDAQPLIHLQLLDALRRGVALQEAVAAWRWTLQPADGLVVLEGRAPTAVVDGLRERGHEVHVVGDWSGLHGHAHVIERTAHGWRAATDPRAEGAATGW